MSEALDFLPWKHTVLEGPTDVGSEQRWKVTSEDGRALVVAQLAPDLARDESIRRRWVRDAERVRDLGVPVIARTLQIGPDPAPRAPGEVPPWRAREDPSGDTLEPWLARAPVTLEEFSAVFTPLAELLQAVHATGAVLRDLRPSQVVRRADGHLRLVDVGLSRVDVLSSHTASSLLLQGSTYAAPEQVRKTAVDLRSDLFSLGVMMWQALTGTLPFGDGPAFLRREQNLPAMSTMRQDVPTAVEQLVRKCLELEPHDRPNTASDVAWILRGGASSALAVPETTACQHCQAELRVGQRLCVQCGRVSVKFVHAQPGEDAYGLDLLRLGEDAGKLRWLQGTIRSISEPPFPPPEFIVGSAHLYSEEEKQTRIRLPARLYNGLSRDSAEQLHSMMVENGIAAAMVGKPDIHKAAMHTGIAAALSAAAAGVAYLVTGSGAALGGMLALGFVIFIVFASRYVNRKQWVNQSFSRYRLRSVPAALPASDPLVSRLAALLSDKTPQDVRAVVSELALLVQRLVDHRAQFVGHAAEFEMLTQPVQPLVEQVVARVDDLAAIEHELEELDEGAMVRALAAAQARRDPPSRKAEILEGLDRLRALEDRRGAVFQRLLEVQSLLTRTVELGLQQHDQGQEHDRQLALAVATLGS